MKYRFFILFFFLFLFIPYSVKANCCECTPPQYSIDGNPKLQRVCANQEGKPCDVVCPSGQIGPSPYPYAQICDANNCPIIDSAANGCCVWTTQDNNIICNTVDSTKFREYDCLYAVNSTIVSRDFVDNIYSCAQEPRCTSDYVVPASSNIQEIKPVEFVPQVTIPGSIDVGGKTFSVNQGQGITVDGSLLSKYIAILFNWLIGAIGVVTVAYLAFGGMQWLAAAGNASGINKAKETIRDSLIGMLLVAGSYTMLYVINPNLVFFGDLQIPDITGKELIAVEGNENATYNSNNSNVGGSCSKLANDSGDCNVISVPVQNFTAAAHNSLYLQNQKVVDDFLAWMTEFKNTASVTPQVTSMFRTPAYQACLYNTLPKGQANKPCYSPHEKGLAVDICQACLNDSQYNILKSTALKHNFKVQNPTKGELESWHFNYIGGNVIKILSGENGICPRTQQCSN